MQPISVGFVVRQANFSPLILQNIDILLSAIRDNNLLMLNYAVNNMEELQVNHILQDIYFRHSAIKFREYSELSLISDCISCMFGTLWCSRDDVRVMW